MKQFETVTLRAGDWEAEIVPGIGMNTASLTFQGTPVLRSPESPEFLRLDPCVYGTPLLMPPNRTEAGRFSFDGKSYQLPVNETVLGNHLHGLVHSQEFTLVQVQGNMLSGIYENRGEIFPFPFRLEVNCILTEEGYAQEFLFTNTGSSDMPLTFGLHTVFSCPGEIRVPIGKRWTVNSCFIPTGELEELTPENECYRTGTDPNGKMVRGFYTSCGNEAKIGDFRYRVTPDFDQWVLWNGDGTSGFCAVEPMRGAVNSLNSGVGLLRLKPGETHRFATIIYRAPLKTPLLWSGQIFCSNFAL